MENAARAIETEQQAAPDESPIDPEAIRAHVARILKTPDFNAAPQLSVFLKYVVERTLAGQGAALKAYTIATEALGRDANFDPQNDPIVRVQARRLRQSLLLYYAGPGAGESLRIVMPVGGYVPEFADTAKASAKPAAAEPAPAPPKPKDNRLFPTPWVAPTALVLSIISIVANLINIWPELLPYILNKFR